MQNKNLADYKMEGKSIDPTMPCSGRKKGIKNLKMNWLIIWYDLENKKMHHGEFTSAEHMKEDEVFGWLGHRSKLHYYWRKAPKPNLFIERLTENSKCKDLKTNDEKSSESSEAISEEGSTTNLSDQN